MSGGELSDGPPDGSDRLAGIRDRVKAANINVKTLLATDYLNHFNEIVMLLDMVPDMPDCLADAMTWAPKSYTDHFNDSAFSEKELAIEAYEHAPIEFRGPFETTVARTDQLVLLSIERIAAALETGNADIIRETSMRASRDLQQLIDVISAIINGSTPTIKQGDIDAMLSH